MEQVQLGMHVSQDDILDMMATSPNKRGVTMTKKQEEEFARLRSSISWLDTVDEKDLDVVDLEEEQLPTTPEMTSSGEIEKEVAKEELESVPASTGGGWIEAEVHHAQASSAPKEPRVIKEGWLTKQGDHWKTWRERWFQLTSVCINYYNSPLDTVPLGTIILDEAHIWLDDSKFNKGFFSKEKCFGWIIAVNKPKLRDFLVYTTREDLRKDWIDAINEVIKSRETQPPKRETILAGGLGATKAGLFEEESEDSSKPSVKIHKKDRPHPGIATPTRFREALKKSRDVKASETEEELQGVLGLCTSTDYKERVPVVADVSQGHFSYCVLRYVNKAVIADYHRHSSPVLPHAASTGDLEELRRKRIGSRDLATSLPVKSEVSKQQFLFATTEGWVFKVKTKTGVALQLAADTKEEMKQWKLFIKLKKVEGHGHPTGEETMNGFLWMQEEKKWSRYYFISDSECMEWFKTGTKDVHEIPLNKIQVCTPRQSEKGSYSTWKSIKAEYRLAGYRDVLELVDLSGTKFSFMVESLQQLEVWVAEVKKHMVLAAAASNIDAFAAYDGQQQQQPEGEGGVSSSSGCIRTSGNRPRIDIRKEASIGTGNAPSAVTNIRNLVKRLRERGDSETGLTSFGNYDVTKSGVGDGHFRILSLDGGGLRAVMEGVLLMRIVEEFPDFLERVDMFAGVSGGAIVASGLAIGRSPEYVCEMFKVLGTWAFKQKAITVGKTFSLKTAKYPGEPIMVGLQGLYPGIKVKDCKKKIAITSFCLDNGMEGTQRSWTPKVMHNFPLGPNKANEKVKSTTQPPDRGASKDLWECVAESTAAPIFFPSFEKHVDGAVMTNNPALTAISLVTGEEVAEPVALPKLHVLSLGTGRTVQYVDGERHDWGMLQWASRLPEMVIGAGMTHQEVLINMLIGERYHRVDPLMESFLPMDDPSVLETLIELAEGVDLEETKEWIRKNFY